MKKQIAINLLKLKGGQFPNEPAGLIKNHLQNEQHS
jgi:hypothetical protein